MKTQKESAQTTFSIGDMACSGCADTVRKALNSIEGVEEASADHEKGTATATYDSTLVSTSDFKQAVEDAGYEFKGREN